MSNIYNELEKMEVKLDDGQEAYFKKVISSVCETLTDKLMDRFCQAPEVCQIEDYTCSPCKFIKKGINECLGDGE